LFRNYKKRVKVNLDDFPINIDNDDGKQRYNTQEDTLKDLVLNQVLDPNHFKNTIIQIDGSKWIDVKKTQPLNSYRYQNIFTFKNKKRKNAIKQGKCVWVIGIESKKREEKKHYNMSQTGMNDGISSDLISVENANANEQPPSNNAEFHKVIQLTLFGNLSKINENLKIFKHQPSLQSLCSLVPNQPSPKKDRRAEFMSTLGGNGKYGYTATDLYESVNICYALESIFENYPSTLFFQYLPQCEKVRDIYRVKRWTNVTKVLYRIAENATHYDSVENVLSKAGVSMTDDDDWNLFLSTPYMSKEEIRKVTKGKKWNHFPGNEYLGRKDLLWKCLKQKIEKLPEEFDIIPKSWMMPNDYKDFAREREVSIKIIINRLQLTKMSYGYESQQLQHEAKELLLFQRVLIVQRTRNHYF
jgi:hypothetical protein